MYKIKIYSPGKIREEWLNRAIDEYKKRLQKTIEIIWLHPKTDKELTELVLKERGAIALDPTGKLLSSEEFASLLYETMERDGARLSLVIGGCEGLPKELDFLPKISLSKMTFTHQMTRLVLLEQIYRAEQIQKGSLYHK